MSAGILMGIYLVFGVYLPAHISPPPCPPSVSKEVTPAVGDFQALQTSIVPVLYAKYEPPKKKAGKRDSAFHVPAGLKNEVDFWSKIYSRYTTDQAVLHDPDDLSKVYAVVKIPHCDEPPTKECLKIREDAVESEKELLKEKLKLGNGAKIRAQVGQKDKFLAGIESSRNYLGDIENVFSEFDIPKEISRLAFVESMFDPRAYSKSGAAGIWQLMPSTAKILGLTVNKQLDERYDPVKSTRAAAKHLFRDYQRLGSWPLALNAYNSGPGRLADASAKLGTKDIVKIIKQYSHPAYGFAARNFYPCFLAVLDVYENQDRYFGKN